MDYIVFNKADGLINQLLGLSDTALPELAGKADSGVIPVANVLGQSTQQAAKTSADSLSLQATIAATLELISPSV